MVMKPLRLVVGGGLLALAILLYALFAEDGWLRVKRLQVEETALREQVQTLQKQNRALAEQAQNLSDDSVSGKAILENAVRRELGFVKSDEKILLLEDSPPEEKDAH